MISLPTLMKHERLAGARARLPSTGVRHGKTRVKQAAVSFRLNSTAITDLSFIKPCASSSPPVPSLEPFSVSLYLLVVWLKSRSSSSRVLPAVSGQKR